MNAPEFIHLHPIGMNATALEKDACEVAARTWLCTGCNAPKPSTGAIDVHIQEKRPGDGPLTFVSGCLVIIAHRDLLETLHPDHVNADLMLGAVRNTSGKVLPDWATVRSRRRVIVRGSEHVGYRRCQVCNRHVYFAMGKPYLFPAPAGDIFIHESDGGLVIRPETVDKRDLEGWPKLGVDNLKVLPEPRDGLGELIQI
jgi:hypothetical protein